MLRGFAAHEFRTIVVGLSVLACLGCSATDDSGTTADSALSESVDSLSESSDAVVVASVGEIVSRENDNGGDANDPGIPMAFYEAGVTEVLRGAIQPGPLIVGWPDLEKASMEDRSELRPGQTVVLFMTRRDDTSAPGIETQGVFYVALGGDNGVMDVVDDRAVA